MTPHPTEQHDPLMQYASTVHTMHHALHRIFTNKKAISESLTRTAAALRSMSPGKTTERSSLRAE